MKYTKFIHNIESLMVSRIRKFNYLIAIDNLEA